LNKFCLEERGGRWERKGAGGHREEMTQLMYAHVNNNNKKTLLKAKTKTYIYIYIF
jgi:hypothetical protein